MLRYTATPPAPSQGAPSHTRPERPKPSRDTVLAEIAEYHRHRRQQDLIWQQLQRRLAAAQS